MTAISLPGSLVPDTLDMCNQAITDRYSDWHSPIFAGAWGLFDTPPELIFVAQNVAFVSAIFVLLVRRLRQWPAVVATWTITLFPTTVGWLGHVGKDQWFVPAFLWGLALLVRVQDARSERTRIIIFLGACGSFWLAVAARQNAILPVAVVMLVAGPTDLLRANRRNRVTFAAKRLAAAGAFSVAVLATQALWTQVVVQPMRTFPQQPTYQFDLAALSARTGELLLPRSSLKPGTTLDDVTSHVTLKGGGGNALFFEPDSPVLFMIQDAEVQDQISRAWREAIQQHPIDYLQHRLAFTSALLGLSAPYSPGALIDKGSRPESFNMRCPLHERYFPALYYPVASGLADLESTNLLRGWWIVLALVAAAAALGLRETESRVLLASGLASLATYAAFGVGPAFRYFWFTSICTLILLGLLLDRMPRLSRPSSRRASPH